MSAHTITLPVVPLDHFDGLELPKYETSGSAGMDVRAALPNGEPITLKPGERQLIPTGLSFAIPDGYEMQVRPRSGLAFKHGITCLNTPGTIDSDYRGELKVLLINLGQEPFEIVRGERVAQLVMAPVTQGIWASVDTLPTTDRGEGGFGSTGKA
ncbi:MAG: dUTP diphosphatase [Ponticaulis sp.]|nr:dUTP diphosphatase [Ponticaulis sp.]|tara:strand:- start:81350 stop:81814 length:465 start_codon:yes stop_codon:yes gene_type:complete